jgi:hypothetical protein
VDKAASKWQVYRTRFLIRAKQLTKPLEFVDVLGREHRGKRGDYLVEMANGTQRIAPRRLFEDVYVVMDPAPPAIGFDIPTKCHWNAVHSSPSSRRRRVQASAACKESRSNPASRPLIA